MSYTAVIIVFSCCPVRMWGSSLILLLMDSSPTSSALLLSMLYAVLGLTLHAICHSLRNFENDVGKLASPNPVHLFCGQDVVRFRDAFVKLVVLADIADAGLDRWMCLYSIVLHYKSPAVGCQLFSCLSTISKSTFGNYGPKMTPLQFSLHWFSFSNNFG